MTRVFYPDYLDGQLHPEAEALLRGIQAAQARPLVALSPEEARASFLPEAWLGPVAPEVRIGERMLPGPAGPVGIRIYAGGGAAPRPVLVFFHGGGFVLGTLPEFDAFCARLALGADCVVVSVDYRLAPEHRFPGAFEDAWAALRWVGVHASEFAGNPERMAVAGDSAGANLAAGMGLLARDAGLRLSAQVLLCPWVDLREGAEAADAFKAFGDGLWLSTANIRWYRDHYLGCSGRAEEPRVSPLLAGNFQGLPPALVITAEFDVLADQGRAYAQRLEGAGVPVDFRAYPGMLHDFATLPGCFSDAEGAIGQVASFLRKAFAGGR